MKIISVVWHEIEGEIEGSFCTDDEPNILLIHLLLHEKLYITKHWVS